MRKTLLLCIIFVAACTNKTSTPLETANTRSFQFTYTVDIESTNGEKLEVWIPVPQSNEVQTISNLKFITHGLEYSVEDEQDLREFKKTTNRDLECKGEEDCKKSEDGI